LPLASLARTERRGSVRWPRRDIRSSRRVDPDQRGSGPAASKVQ